MAAALGLLAPAAAQQAMDVGAPRLAAVHHSALPYETAGEASLQVQLPRPRLDAWEAVTVETDAACLEPGELGEGLGGPALTVAVRGLAPGDSCSGTLVVRFGGGGAEEALAAAVHVHRLSVPGADERLSSSYSVDLVPRGVHGPGFPYPPAPYVELLVRNDAAHPVRVVRLAELARLRSQGFEAFVFVDGDRTGLEGRQPVTDDLDVDLAPGQALTLAVVADLRAELPQDAAVASVAPALLVDVGGELRSVVFDEVSFAWGPPVP